MIKYAYRMMCARLLFQDGPHKITSNVNPRTNIVIKLNLSLFDIKVIHTILSDVASKTMLIPNLFSNIKAIL